MMRLVGVISVLSLLVVPAEAAQVRYVGSFHIVSKTNNGKCTEYDPVGDRGAARFRPVLANVPDNGNNATLSIFYNDGARNFRVSGNFTATFKQAQGTNLFDTASAVDDPFQFVRFATQSPPTLASNTRFITITGEVNNYDYMLGCRVQFGLVLQKRVD